MVKLLRASALVFSLCAIADAQAAEAVLLRTDREFNAATQSRRAEGWMSFMADDVVLLREKPTVGREAVGAEIQKTFADPNFVLTWEPVRGEMFKSGDMGYTVGRWTASSISAQGQKRTSQGTYLTVWKKQADGSWKAIWDGGASDERPQSGSQ
jgi:ketosteroid isomerase-like protein